MWQDKSLFHSYLMALFISFNVDGILCFVVSAMTFSVCVWLIRKRKDMKAA